MRNYFLILLSFVTSSIFSQTTMEFTMNLYPDTKTFDGSVTICNNSGKSFPGGYKMKGLWPAVSSITYGLTIVNSGSTNCDSITLATDSWETISNGQCEKIDIGGKYNPPMFVPPKLKGEDGTLIEIKHSATSYIPGAENAGSPTSEFYFKKDCFIKTPQQIELGEATLLEWGVATDMYFPDNKKTWALANVHAYTLFNNLVGKVIITPNHYNATTLNESHCGCENGLVNDPSATNQLSYQAHTVADGCFQMTPTGWLQIEQFFPELLKGLSHSSIVPGDYVRSNILRAYYDMTSLLYWEKAKCYKPLDMIDNSKDPYFAEELFGMAFYRGFDFSGIEKIFNSKRSTYLASENLVESLHTSGDVDNGTVVYGMRQRNNAKQLDNNLTASWATNSMYYDPSIFKWRGWYNDDVAWTDVNAYLDELKPLFPGVNWTNLKSTIQTTFNSINSGSAVPFQQIGPVIDEIVLNLPAYDGNKGMSVVYNSDVSACNSSGIAISTCSKLCPGEEGEITVNLMGTPPFSYTINGPNNEKYTASNIAGSPVVLNVNDPGIYTVETFSDANGSPFINCHFASAEVENAGTDDVDWDRSKFNDELNCLPFELKLIGSGNGPWVVDYTINNVPQTPINFSSSPYTLSIAPLGGKYKITRMQAGGCDSPNNSEIEVCYPVSNRESIQNNIVLYPNPIDGRGKLHINSSEEIKSIKIFNLTGELLVSLNQGSNVLDVSKLSSGSYFVIINTKAGEVLHRVQVLK